MTSENYLSDVETTIAEICGVHGLSPDQDFYDAGVSSVQALPLLMELETRFGVMIPDERFVAARTVRALSAVLCEIKEA